MKYCHFPTDPAKDSPRLFTMLLEGVERNVNWRERPNQYVMAEGAEMGTTGSKRMENSVNDVVTAVANIHLG